MKVAKRIKEQNSKHKVCFFLSEKDWENLQYLRIKSKKRVPAICAVAVTSYVNRELPKYDTPPSGSI